MKIDFRTLANFGVRELTPYQPGKPIEELQRELGITSPIKLASNENPLGPSPLAIEATQAALLQAHIYPDGGCYELKNALAAFLNLEPDQITVGNGSENILELIIKAYIHQNNHAVISQYAFLTIPLLLQSYGSRTTVVPAKNWGHDIDAMIAAINDQTRLLFLVNPNNPTGTYTPKNDFQRLMESVPEHVLVVVDEAYADYIDCDDYPNTIPYLNKYPNLIITRTFSKVYGLAALRLGYAISSEDIADILNRARLPFNVNTIATKAACAAILDQSHVRNSIALNRRGLEQVASRLKQLKHTYIPSICNFISIDVGNSGKIYQKLLTQGIIVRPLAAYGMHQHIRVTIGTEEHNTRFLDALEYVTQ